jgi:hypothetical protein
MAGKVKYPLVTKVEGEKAWITYMNNQVFKKNNCINAVFTGIPGSGKSWAMLSMAEQLDPNFTLEGNWFFKAGPMMAAIKEYYFGENADPKPGKIWCLDEGGIDLNSMSFHDAINRGLNAFFQTARHRNYIFLMSVPYLRFISKGVRTLMTTHCKAEGWTKDSETILVPRVMEYNGDLDKNYRKRLIVRSKNGGMSYCNKTHLPKPSKRLVGEYEKMKAAFTGNLFEEISASINAYEGEEKSKAEKAQGKVRLSYNQRLIYDTLKEGKSLESLADTHNIKLAHARSTLSALRYKGFKFKPIKKENNGNKGHVVGYEIIQEPGIID